MTGTVSRQKDSLTRMDALYEKIGKFLEAHPEAMDMSNEESDRLFEQWVKTGKA
jgi:hypothetical protein